jgi:hypothetical protein
LVVNRVPETKFVLRHRENEVLVLRL